MKTLKENVNSPSVFMNMCIHFKFLNRDLETFFPNGVLVENFSLDEDSAEKWWQLYFDNELFIEPERFFIPFSDKFPTLCRINDVMKRICFSSLEWWGNINKNSFNMFLRYYGGWDKLDCFWLDITTHPGNMNLITLESGLEELEKIQQMLMLSNRNIEKSYLFYIDWTSPDGLWNLIYGDKNDEIKCEIMKIGQLMESLKTSTKFRFPRGLKMPQAGAAGFN